VDELAPHIFSWTAPHPEYRPRAEEVVSYALIDDGALALVDPLLPADEERRAALLAELDELAGAAQRLELLVTVPYHTRSSEELYRRFAGPLPVRLWGHALVRRRLEAGTPLEEVPHGAAGTCADVADGTAQAYTIGRPRRSEYPLFFPALRAVVFGDAVVGAEGGVRFWNLSAGTGADWYRDVFAPTLAPLAARDVEYVLVTHGPPVLKDGRRALAECLAAPPVDMY
jgi:glyoxylase-like metal-dependent hydrolase (beta-lactamase superfamily II)